MSALNTAGSVCNRAAAPADAFWDDGPRCLVIALVNNMPAAAVESTERQFQSLVTSAAGYKIRLEFYTLPESPRTGIERDWVNRYYGETRDLMNRYVDGVIVTGTEPHSSNLTEEPYYRSLAQLVDWAGENSHSAIWSCLAAHAAVFHLDGIERTPLAQKRFGLFECVKQSEHVLTRSVSERFYMPHSRWNELPQQRLEQAGYRVLTSSEIAGADSFVKEGKSLLVFFQGHPEYEPETLGLEYCRDVRRFLRGEQERYPSMPQDYFDQATADSGNAFRQRVLDRGTAAIPHLAAAVARNAPRNTWYGAATRIYRNWLLYLSTGKERRLRTRQRRRTAPQAA